MVVRSWADGRSVVWVAFDGSAVGLIAIADAPRPTSKQAVSALREAGIEVVMLTGNNEASARRIANQVGINTVIAEVLSSWQQADRRGATVRRWGGCHPVGDGRQAGLP